ncbi:two-component system histidine kinase PnpS [Cytobacillus sp. FSL R7-0696]|uniref:two-component system histidine kinase PnpS n=1 Tax=Cytobacillus TaxID=2675230 RepID=UPI0030F8DBF5
MKTFRSKLFFAIITLIIAVLLCLGLLLGQLFKSYYINVIDERLSKEIQLVAGQIEEIGGIEQLTQEKVDQFANWLGVNVTIANANDRVIFDSVNKEIQMKNRKTINEILGAADSDEQAGKVVGDDYHYFWKELNEGTNSYYLFLSAEIDEVKSGYSQIWWILIICLSLALILIIFLGAAITNRYTRPIDSATRVAIELAKGNYRARTYDNDVGEAGKLNSSINILARNLQDMEKSREMHQDRLSTLIENMGSGLILIDSKGYINLVNRTYREVFHADVTEYMDELYYNVIEYKEITELIEELFMTEQKVRKQIQILIGIHRKHFEVYGVPIIGTNDVWKGVLLVFHDITEIKKLEQVRRDFVANVSHELKTPITSIKGFSETLLDGAMDDQDALNQFLTIILQESERLQTLIQDLLDLSKIEQQGFHLSIQEVNIIGVLNEVVMMVKRRAEEKEITIDYKCEDEIIEMEADVNRIKQIFLNIVSNAISYTPNEGKVSIRVTEDQQKVYIKIMDTGIGIKESEIPRIFERFYRVDKARSRNSGGTGLGLAIVKHLLEAHKGLISVESKSGKGTAFLLTFYKKLPDSE